MLVTNPMRGRVSEFDPICFSSVMNNPASTTFLGLLLSLVIAGCGGRHGSGDGKPPIAPLPRAHAHNDYEHPRPLLDALDSGFCSVEADVWLVNGRLLVAHDLDKVRPEGTLQTWYLDPLRERISRNRGRVFLNGPAFTLMIDVKSDAAETYVALRAALQNYTDFLTTFTTTNSTVRGVTIILSGNRATELVAAEPLRVVALDGRLSDLDANPPLTLFPLISDDWRKHFTWRGDGRFSRNEQEKLHQLVSQARAQGRRIRFWATPDSAPGWRELRDADVDLIGTDNLSGLAAFLRESKP